MEKQKKKERVDLSLIDPSFVDLKLLAVTQTFHPFYRERQFANEDHVVKSSRISY